MRTNVYVDAFNLYYGAVRGTRLKWLDLEALCRHILPKNEINQIRYFTALVQSRPGNPQQAQRQQAYIRALETSPIISVHYGRYLTSKVRMALANPVANGPRTVEVLKTEEKGSDVNLATYLLVDGFNADYEVAIVMSNDSDLVHPISVVRDDLHLSVGVFNPHPNQTSWALRNVAAFYRRLRPSALRACQFPPTLRDSHGEIRKPSSW